MGADVDRPVDDHSIDALLSRDRLWKRLRCDLVTDETASARPQAPSSGDENEKIVIRRAREEDLVAVAALAAKLVRMHHAVDPSRFFVEEPVERGYEWWFGREIRRKEAVILVAARGEEIVGYCYGTIEERDWNLLLDEHGAIHDVLVDDRARKGGVGKQLVDATCEALEAMGAPRIVLSTMVSNERAQRVFKSCGFRPTMLEMTRDRPPAEAGAGAESPVRR